MALTFGEDSHQHIRALSLLPTGRLHMNHGALDDTMKDGRRLCLFPALPDEILKLIIDIVGHRLPQRGEVDVAGAHYGGGIDIIARASRRCSRVAYSCLRCVAKVWPSGWRHAGCGKMKATLYSFQRLSGTGYAPSFLLHDALERVLMLAGEVHDLRHLVSATS